MAIITPRIRLLQKPKRQSHWTSLVTQEIRHTAFSFLACRMRLKCDGTRAEIRFCLSAKRTSPFKSAGASVQSTTGSRGVRISGNNAGYTMFRGSVKSTGDPLHSPVSPSLPPLSASTCAITFQLDSNAGYTMFRGSVKGTGYPLHSPVPSSLPLPYVTVCHHTSTGLYHTLNKVAKLQKSTVTST